MISEFSTVIACKKFSENKLDGNFCRGGQARRLRTTVHESSPGAFLKIFDVGRYELIRIDHWKLIKFFAIIDVGSTPLYCISDK